MPSVVQDTHNIKHDTDIHLLLERGRRITLDFGARQWQAVYWGGDADGDILAHHIEGRWRFVHFDLRAARDKLVVRDLLSLQEIHEIEKDVLEDSDALAGSHANP